MDWHSRQNAGRFIIISTGHYAKLYCVKRKKKGITEDLHKERLLLHLIGAFSIFAFIRSLSVEGNGDTQIVVERGGEGIVTDGASISSPRGKK